mmetsp:Transcript_11104/g.37703  ORF Transcript_11104/g.37703 Transcript_11104/m.37703 type:complete len:265 (-) Transcript_11104:1712-2506(-)
MEGGCDTLLGVERGERCGGGGAIPFPEDRSGSIVTMTTSVSTTILNTNYKNLPGRLLLRLLQLGHRPRWLHELSPVVLADRLERVDLDDFLPQLLSRVDELLLLLRRLALLLAARAQDLVRIERQRHGPGDLVDPVALLLGHKHVVSEQSANFSWAGDQVRHVPPQRVLGREVLTAPGERQHPHHRPEARDGEVREDPKESLLDLVAAIRHRDVQNLAEPLDVLVVLIVPQAGIPNVEVAENVSISPGDVLCCLQASSHRHSNI